MQAGYPKSPSPGSSNVTWSWEGSQPWVSYDQSNVELTQDSKGFIFAPMEQREGEYNQVVSWHSSEAFAFPCCHDWFPFLVMTLTGVQCKQSLFS